MAPAVSNTNSETGRAIHGGITGFVVSGGSPDPTCDFNTTLPTITSARCVAAFPSVERSHGRAATAARGLHATRSSERTRTARYNPALYSQARTDAKIRVDPALRSGPARPGPARRDTEPPPRRRIQPDAGREVCSCLA